MNETNGTPVISEPIAEVLSVTLDQWFLIVMGMQVFFMQCGFAFLEAGAVRSKNVTNMLLKNLFDAFASGVAYWTLGYAFAFGSGNEFIGYEHFASDDLPRTEYANFFFQYTFAATASTIVSGAVAERCEFVAYFLYSVCITGFIFPVVTHWVWSGQGFLSNGRDYGGDIGVVGYTDFAGSGVVHCVGGTASFVGAVLLGPRIGRFHKPSKTVIQLRGHSVPIAALGGFILFFGFLAFNGGSQLSISHAGDGAAVSAAVVNTIICASFAASSSLLIYRTPLFGSGTWSLLVTINGAITGMVAVCAGCNNMYPWGACALGCCAGVVYLIWSWIIRSLKVDDPLDAVAVHFGGGSLGVIAISFLHKTDGILFRWDQRSGMFFAWQLAGLATIATWSGLTSFLVFGTLKLLKILRVPEEVELRGLDIPKHNEPAYPVEAYGHGHVEKILQILDKFGPVKVTHAFEKHNGHVNTGFQDLTDKGPYEHPEVNRTLYHVERHISTDSSNSQATEQTEQPKTVVQNPTPVSKSIQAVPVQTVQSKVYYTKPIRVSTLQPSNYFAVTQPQKFYVYQPGSRETLRL